MINGKITDQIFTKSGAIDTRKVLNRSQVNLTNEILDKIEEGITIEQLEEMNLPIFMYNTQITIHGIFPELSWKSGYSYGYKHIFQNKNMSIGIKYGAIDEQKRQFLKSRLRHLGFNYHKTSSEEVFYMQKRIENDEQKNEILNKWKPIFDKVNEKLFYGKKNIYLGKDLYGRVFAMFEIVVNAMYEKNIQTFLNEMGLTPEFVNEKEKEIEAENKETELRYEMERQMMETKKAEILKENENIIQEIEKLEKMQITEPGLYINYEVDGYKPENLKFVIVANNVYKPNRAKILRCNQKKYDNLNDAMNHDGEGYNDGKFRSKKHYYKVPEKVKMETGHVNKSFFEL